MLRNLEAAFLQEGGRRPLWVYSARSSWFELYDRRQTRRKVEDGGWAGVNITCILRKVERF
jgi:hypothetical protein